MINSKKSLHGLPRSLFLRGRGKSRFLAVSMVAVGIMDGQGKMLRSEIKAFFSLIEAGGGRATPGFPVIKKADLLNKLLIL